MSDDKLYLQGDGVEPNKALAEALLAGACENGDQDSCRTLTGMRRKPL